MSRIKSLINKYKNRIKYGFFDDETWNLDYTMAKFILPRLKRFRDITKCYPPELKSLDEWQKILDKMIWGFDSIVNGYDDFLNPEHNKKQQEGLDLFSKYFTALWW